MLYIKSHCDYTLYMLKGQINESLPSEQWVLGSGEIFNHYLKYLQNLELSKAHVNAHLIPIRNNQVMLSLRQNTGYFDGQYGLVCGHVEHSESARSGLIREVEEEAYLTLAPEQLKLAHTMHHMKDRNNVSFFYMR